MCVRPPQLPLLLTGVQFIPDAGAPRPPAEEGVTPLLLSCPWSFMCDWIQMFFTFACSF